MRRSMTLCFAVLAVSVFTRISSAQVLEYPVDPEPHPTAVLISEAQTIFAEVFSSTSLPDYSPLFTDQDVLTSGSAVSGTAPWSSEAFVFYPSLIVPLDWSDYDPSPQETADLTDHNVTAGIVGGTIYTSLGGSPCVMFAVKFTQSEDDVFVLWPLYSLSAAELSDYASMYEFVTTEFALPVCNVNSAALDSWTAERRAMALCKLDTLAQDIPFITGGAFVAGFSCSLAFIPPATLAAIPVCIASTGYTAVLLRHHFTKTSQIYNDLLNSLLCACNTVTHNPSISLTALRAACPIPSSCSP